MLLLNQYTKVVHTTDNLTDMYEEGLMGFLQSGRTEREDVKVSRDETENSICRGKSTIDLFYRLRR